MKAFLGAALLLAAIALGCGPSVLKGGGGDASAGSGAAGRGAGGGGGLEAAGSGGRSGADASAGSGAAGRGAAGGGGIGGAGGAGRSGADAAAGGASGGTAGTGGGAVAGSGARGGSGPSCTPSQIFDRSCTSDGDCAIGVQNGCINTYVGLRTTELTRFQIYQQECNPEPPHSVSSCDFAPLPPVTQDGSSIVSGTAAAVACQAGTCATYSAACGRVCDTGTACFFCPTTQGTTYAACSTTCGFTACKDPSLPSCQTAPPFAGPKQDQFCAPDGMVCCYSCPQLTDASATLDAPRDAPPAN
jgi:hypothetical protein